MDEKFGKFVRNKREEKKINLRKLAEILEIAPAYMSDMEKARRYPPDKEKLAKIAEALELTEDEANTMYDYAALAKDNSVSPVCRSILWRQIMSVLRLEKPEIWEWEIKTGWMS